MTSVYVSAAIPAVRAGLRSMLDGAGLPLVDHLPADVVVLADPDLIEELTASPTVQAVVLLAADDRGAGSLQSLRLTGWAILPENASADQLVAAVHAAAAGLIALPADSATSILPRQTTEVADQMLEPLTPRELEVLQLVSQGLSNKLIARQLTISEHTVKFHVSSTYAKLGAASRTEAVSLAARKGLITL